MSERRGKVIPFPKRHHPPPQLSEALILRNIAEGYAEHLATFRHRGRTCECYRLYHEGQVTFVFNVRT